MGPPTEPVPAGPARQQTGTRFPGGLRPALLSTRREVSWPVVVADAGYGVGTPFRLGLQEREPSCVLALNGEEVATDR